MLALGAVPQDKVVATHEFINAKILPKSTEQTTRSHAAWPPPPPAGEHDGMPCGVYVSQFTLQALYKNAADHGQAALQLLTSTAKNSWLNMIKQGATASMEAWTPDEKPNLTWRYTLAHSLSPNAMTTSDNICVQRAVQSRVVRLARFCHPVVPVWGKFTCNPFTCGA